MQFDPEQLPGLSDPYQPPSRFGDFKQIANTLKGLQQGNLGGVNYEIGSKKLELETMLKDARIKALLGYDGNVNINASKPIYGGTLDVSAGRNNGQNSFGVQFNKRF